MGKLSLGPSLQTPGGSRVRLKGGGLGPRGQCGLLGAARGWHGGQACSGVLPVAMVTGPTMMDWSRPRQEVGQGRLSPIGSSRLA
jgi:hypothetical protein